MTVAATVVLPTWNRAAVLGASLRTLAAQSLDPHLYEVVVVDDGSTDGTPNVVEDAQRAAACEVRVVRLGGRTGIPAARNRGIEQARGEIIVFVDSDELAPPSFLAAHLDAHRRGGDAVVCTGPVVSTGSLDRPFEARAGVMDFSTAYFDSNNASVRRAHLVRAGLFDETFYPYGWEGLELGYRLRALGLRRAYRRDAAIYHYQPEVTAAGFAAMLEKEAAKAQTAHYFYAKHPTLEVRLALSMTPFHRWLNAVQRGFGAIHAGNALAWEARARRRGFPGLGRMLLAGVLNERYLSGLQKVRKQNAMRPHGDQRRHPNV